MRLTILIVLAISAAAPLPAATPEEGLAFFEKRIRPLLQEHCHECHSADAKKVKGGLRLDSREGWVKGGESGPAIVPGKPDESLLIRGVRYWDKDFQMPPKHPLPPEGVKDLVEWVKLGAPDPRAGEAAVTKAVSQIDYDQGRKHWAFQPVPSVVRPKVKNSSWPRNDVDTFTLAKMEQAAIAPAPDADPRTLIRRMTFDLTGLPPTPEEVEVFIAGSTRNPPSAIRNLADRLLASPQYGERWGRHWLDVVRYADTSGNASDYPVPQAHKYRDYVIAAFNEDLPFDQFVREQIAGDLLPTCSAAEWERRVIATGYVASARRFAGGIGETHLTIEDAIENTGRTFLGLSLSCARCHDHKFDPVSTADYYALYGVFSSTTFPHPGSEGKNRPENLRPLLPPAEFVAVKKLLQEKLDALDAEAKQHEEARVAAEKESDGPERKGKVAQAKKDRDAAREKRRVLAEAPPSWSLAYAVGDGPPADARLHVRGDPTRLGETVPRHFPTILGGQPLGDAKSSGRRELAEAIASPTNVLTARVMVNRIWQHHFGRGLVTTPNDFGLRGQPPTHPELLDFLAGRFVASGWSVKAMHRLILTSRTWQLASAGAGEDPLWSRAARRRLDAESVRDALLFVSGDLDAKPGGAHPFPAVSTWSFTQHNQFFASYDTSKRTVYQMQQRLRRHPFLLLFDGADPNSSTAQRQATTTPLQSLFVMNDPFIHKRAENFAARVLREKSDEAVRIEWAFQILYARPPSPEEAQLAASHLALLTANQLSLEKAWQSLGRALLAANEFLYLD